MTPVCDKNYFQIDFQIINYLFVCLFFFKTASLTYKLAPSLVVYLFFFSFLRNSLRQSLHRCGLTESVHKEFKSLPVSSHAPDLIWQCDSRKPSLTQGESTWKFVWSVEMACLSSLSSHVLSLNFPDLPLPSYPPDAHRFSILFLSHVYTHLHVCSHFSHQPAGLLPASLCTCLQVCLNCTEYWWTWAKQ